MADLAKVKSAEDLSRNVRSLANWCYWVAGLTAVNAAVMLSGNNYSFLFGMILPQVAAQMAATAGPIAKAVAIGLNLGAIGFFVLMGWLAKRENRWAFVLAFLAYGADSLLLIAAPQVFMILFHGWVLFSLFAGIGTIPALRNARAAEAAGQPLTPKQAFMPVGLGTSPENVDRAAREMEEMTRILYGQKHERRAVEASTFRHLDLKFYERVERELTALGFHYLGDYELADLKGTAQDPGCFLRAMASADGVVMAAAYQHHGRKWWLRMLMWFLTRDGMKVVDLETEFSDGSFVATGTCPIVARVKLPPEIDGVQLPHKTPLPEMLANHLARVEARLHVHPELTVRPVTTLEECHAAQERQDAIKAAFRQQLGGMTREELLAHANTDAKREAAELLWARMQERKQAAAATPPLLPG